MQSFFNLKILYDFFFLEKINILLHPFNYTNFAAELKISLISMSKADNLLVVLNLFWNTFSTFGESDKSYGINVLPRKIHSNHFWNYTDVRKIAKAF